MVGFLQEELKAKQKTLVQQLQRLFGEALLPPLRCLLARGFVTLYSTGNTFSLFDTINKLTDIIKAKDEGGSAQAANKLLVYGVCLSVWLCMCVCNICFSSGQQ